VILTALTCLKIKAVLCLMIIEKINPVATQSQLSNLYADNKLTKP